MLTSMRLHADRATRNVAILDATSRRPGAESREMESRDKKLAVAVRSFDLPHPLSVGKAHFDSVEAASLEAIP